MKKYILWSIFLLIIGCGKKDGVHTEYFYGGEHPKLETTYKDGKKNGLETVWWDYDEKREEGNYKDGKKDGLWTDWKQPYLRSALYPYKREITYKDGQVDGPWTRWEYGKKYEGTYKDGQVDGLTTIWYEKDSAGNRQKEEETTYKDGKKDGLETKWYENGKIKQQGNWNSSGVFIGFKWDENGKKENLSISPPKVRNEQLGTGKNECPCCGRRFDHSGYRMGIQNVVRPGAYDSESCAIVCEKVNGLMK